MAAQAVISAKTAISAYSLTGTDLSINPRGKNEKGVLSWIAPGTTTLEDLKVDFSYRTPTATRKSTKAMLRVFSPKTAVDSTTSETVLLGSNSIEMNTTLAESATPTEKAKLYDVFVSTVCDPAFRDAYVNGNVMYS